MPLISWCRKTLALEDMAEMAPAVGADNFGPRHAPGVVLVSGYSTGNAVEVSWPPAAGFELMVGLV